jgi:hypothetical protein
MREKKFGVAWELNRPRGVYNNGSHDAETPAEGASECGEGRADDAGADLFAEDIGGMGFTASAADSFRGF